MKCVGDLQVELFKLILAEAYPLMTTMVSGCSEAILRKKVPVVVCVDTVHVCSMFEISQSSVKES